MSRLSAVFEAALSVLGSFRQGGAHSLGVGAERITFRESGLRRAYDLTPAEDLYFDGPAGAYLQRELAALSPRLQHQKAGGAGGFLDFLVDDVRPVLASEYRMDPEDHGLLGFSVGGAFVAMRSSPDQARSSDTSAGVPR